MNDETCSTVEVFTVGNVDGPEASVTTTPASCLASDGTATFTPDNYTYKWNDGVEGSSRNDLQAKDYQVTVEDGSGCFDVVTVTIDEQSDLTGFSRKLTRNLLVANPMDR